MLPIAAGLAFSDKLAKRNNISIAFLGDGTLGEGILYETLNISSLWNIPIVYILEKNSISQSTSFHQIFSGSIPTRISGFGIKHYSTSVYDLAGLDETFNIAFNYCRESSKPIFIEVELGRLNSHSKGDDNRDPRIIEKLNEIDPLNIFIRNNELLVQEWTNEVELIFKNSLIKAIFISR